MLIIFSTEGSFRLDPQSDVGPSNSHEPEFIGSNLVWFR
jgi:hypothetical protein